MDIRDHYPPGVPCWVDTSQPDPQAAVGFYGPLFGWELEDGMPAEVDGNYFTARLEGHAVAAIGSRAEGEPGPVAWTTYVSVEDADATAARVRDAGGNVLAEPFDVLDAGRMAVLADPAGAVLCLWQPGTTVGAQVVNDPGTWNFSGLHTPDPEGAKAFYGAVFGWEASELGGAGGAGYFRLPAYGDFLEERNPGTRERNAEFGAPDRFEEAVAWLTPIAPGDAVPPHWDVTFGVADADATAARAVELGGPVSAPPTDAPWVRTTVIADPQGAVFTASKFVPPEA